MGDVSETERMEVRPPTAEILASAYPVLRRFAAVVGSVSARARSVLYLHYVDGEPFETIARTLEIRPSTVRQIATRARRQLRTDEEEST